MSRGRAYTRHQRERFWKRTYNYWKNVVYRGSLTRFFYGSDEPEIVELTNHSYKNRKGCSCPMCGHYRESMGPTIQELKQPPFIPEEDLDD